MNKKQYIIGIFITLAICAGIFAYVWISGNKEDEVKNLEYATLPDETASTLLSAERTENENSTKEDEETGSETIEQSGGSAVLPETDNEMQTNVNNSSVNEISSSVSSGNSGSNSETSKSNNVTNTVPEETTTKNSNSNNNNNQNPASGEKETKKPLVAYGGNGNVNVEENPTTETVMNGSSSSGETNSNTGSSANTSGNTSGNSTSNTVPNEMVLSYQCYDSTGVCVVQSGSYASGRVTIPSTHTENGKTYKVVAIDTEAFVDCKKLCSITIPSTVTIIEKNAFMNCHSLTEVKMEEGITFIAEKAFYNCTGLVELTLPSSITKISYDAFAGCINLKTIHATGSAASAAEGAKAQDNSYIVTN